MTSKKRDFSEMCSIATEASSSADSSEFVFNPRDPLYTYKFIDELVEQHRSCNTRSPTPVDLECSPRAYEDSYLREPVNNERGCANDSACQGLCVPCEAPFVLREFRLPSEVDSDMPHGLCLMCRRFEIARQYFRNASGDVDVPSSVHISKYYNVVGVQGEYDVRDCIVNRNKHTGLVLPVVLHVRSAYELSIVDGVKYYKQTHYANNTAECDASGPAFLCRGAVLQQRESTARCK